MPDTRCVSTLFWRSKNGSLRIGQPVDAVQRFVLLEVLTSRPVMYLYKGSPIGTAKLFNVLMGIGIHN